MKTLIMMLLVISAYQARAEVELVPLDMALGYWETNSEMDVEAMLANLPKEQREMMRGMMSSKMQIPVIKQCITKEFLEDMEKQMKQSYKSAGSDCDLEVVTSNAQEFNGVLTCAGGKSTITISTRTLGSKRIESQVTANMDGMGQNNIKTVGEWKSATCPAGI